MKKELRLPHMSCCQAELLQVAQGVQQVAKQQSE